ncbi:MAG: DUF1284 domain-containing protein [Firmicutes bacterium]|nr:DUF1284 domain-containing protein [Bacillota bacterium]
MKLRAHHLLCTQGFVGMGYSDAFTRNMADVVARMDAGEAIEVVDLCDDICAACPHRKGTACGASDHAEADIQALDARARAQLGFAVGEVVDVSLIHRSLRQRPVAQKLPEICVGCQWLSHGVCQQALQRLEGGLPVHGAV